MSMPDENAENFVCPICGKDFIRTDDMKYITHGGYTCSWECFLKAIREKPETQNKKGK